MTKGIPLTRTIGNNILANKHDIHQAIIDGVLFMPRVDSDNPRHIEEVQGNHLRVMKRYPLLYDFIMNMLTIQIARGDQMRQMGSDEGIGYIAIRVPDKDIHDYLHNKSTTLWPILTKEGKWDEKGWVLPSEKKSQAITIRNRNGHIIEVQPIVRMGRNVDRGVSVFYILEDLFIPIVEGDYYKKGGDGYIHIPPRLFPLSMRARALSKSNPPYRLHILAALRNTHKVSEIQITRDEFTRKVFPEHYREGGYLDCSIPTLHGNMKTSLDTIRGDLRDGGYTGPLPYNLYIGSHGGNTTIYVDNSYTHHKFTPTRK